ncbi:MAG: transglycosylase domain-containing protein [Anaerolineaceae bacterium]
MKEDPMRKNDADPDDTGRNGFGELNSFQDFDNPDRTPPSAEQDTQETTVPGIPAADLEAQARTEKLKPGADSSESSTEDAESLTEDLPEDAAEPSPIKAGQAENAATVPVPALDSAAAQNAETLPIPIHPEAELESAPTVLVSVSDSAAAQSAETVPVPVNEESEAENAVTMLASVPDAAAAQSAETVPLPMNEADQAENAQTVPLSVPDSAEAQPAEAPAQPGSPETKREATQPLEIAKTAAPEPTAWFSEIASYDEKVGSAPKAPAPKPAQPRGDFFTGDWVRPKPAQTAPTGTWNTKPTGAWIPPAAPQDNIPTIPPAVSVPPLASGGQPLPIKKVTETDPGATRLSPSAFSQRQASKAQGAQPAPASGRQAPMDKAQTRRSPVQAKPSQAAPAKKKAAKALLPVLFVILALIFVGMLFVGVQYFRIASTLPSVAELRSRASQFETTRILDRRGNILYEINDPNMGKRTYVPLDKISPYLIAATIATEDKEYYNHPGFDLVALVRALWTNYTSGEIVSGGSTITQQLARMLLLQEERFEQTYDRKAREIILAAEITRRYSKEEVLELYLNEIFYGNLSYGIEAAAETYFNTPASDLQLWQASFLAGLPQSPAIYDIYNNRDATLTRNKAVLVLTYELSNEKNCIYIGENLEKVCVSANDALNAADTLEAYPFTQNTNSMRFPHWVVYIQSLLESQYDSQTIYHSGFTIYTTLDPELQDLAQRAVQEQLATMTANNATNGALVAMDPNTGEILAMVGSADFYNDAISGQVNMALTETRQPGSSIKPITYLAAFEKDWTPSTLIWDVPGSFPPSGREDDPSAPYEPVNYDGRFHGPVTVRSALANSYNIPAVKTLQYVGIYDDPNTNSEDGFIAMAKRLGITSLTREDYGLSLTLGGGEVSLLQLTGAYSVLANEGKRVAPEAITKVVDYTGKVVFEYNAPEGDQVVRAAHAYLITSILSDANARAPMFGRDSILNLPFAAAAKTGTTNDYRDNWTLGYTPDLVVGVWVGNADYSPMVNTTGISGAAPIWARVMEDGINLLKGSAATPFTQPQDVVERTICSASGTEPSDYCPSQRTEIFASDQLPPSKEHDLWAKVQIDGWTGLRASAACSDFAREELVVNVSDKDAVRWLKTDPGKNWAQDNGFPDPFVILPERECRADDPRAVIDMVTLTDGRTITENPFKIVGVIDATANFKEFKIDWGEGEKPGEWNTLVDWENTPVRSAEEIYSWDLTGVTAEIVTVRIRLRSTVDTQVEKRFTLHLAVPTPTPTPTEVPTETPTEIPTVTPTPTPPLETPEPPPTPTPGETLPPSDENP